MPNRVDNLHFFILVPISTSYSRILKMEILNGMKEGAMTTLMTVSSKLEGVRGLVVESTTNWVHDQDIPFEFVRKYFRNQEAKQRRITKTHEYRRRYSGDIEELRSSPNLLQNVIVKENSQKFSAQGDTVNVPTARRFRKSSAPDILINYCVSRHNLLSTDAEEKRKLSACDPAQKSSIPQILESLWSREERKKTLPSTFYCRKYSRPERSLMEPAWGESRRISAPEQTILQRSNKMKVTNIGRRKDSIQDNEFESIGICHEGVEEKKGFTKSKLMNSTDALNKTLSNHQLLKRRSNDTVVYPKPRGKIDSIADVELPMNHIQLTIHHEHKRNLLTVTIHRVRIFAEAMTSKTKIFATVNLSSSTSQKQKSRSINCEKAKVWEDDFIFKKMTMADLEESSIEIKIYLKMKFPKFSKYHSKTTVALCDVNIYDFATTTKNLEC